jgi:hypothetical protein
MRGLLCLLAIEPALTANRIVYSTVELMRAVLIQSLSARSFRSDLRLISSKSKLQN